MKKITIVFLFSLFFYSLFSKIDFSEFNNLINKIDEKYKLFVISERKIEKEFFKVRSEPYLEREDRDAYKTDIINKMPELKSNIENLKQILIRINDNDKLFNEIKAQLLKLLDDMLQNVQTIIDAFSKYVVNKPISGLTSEIKSGNENILDVRSNAEIAKQLVANL